METWSPRGFKEWKVQQITPERKHIQLCNSGRERGLHISWALHLHFTCRLRPNLTVLSQLKPPVTGHRCSGVRDEFQRDVSGESLCNTILSSLPFVAIISPSRFSSVRATFLLWVCGKIHCLPIVTVSRVVYGISCFKVMLEWLDHSLLRLTLEKWDLYFISSCPRLELWRKHCYYNIISFSFLIHFKETTVLAHRSSWLNFTAIIWQLIALVNHIPYNRTFLVVYFVTRAAWGLGRIDKRSDVAKKKKLWQV